MASFLNTTPFILLIFHLIWYNLEIIIGNIDTIDDDGGGGGEREREMKTTRVVMDMKHDSHSFQKWIVC